MKCRSHDPVHRDKEDMKWYFWDETWADRNGPFDTELIAREKLKKYGEFLEHGNVLRTFLCYWELHVDDRTFYIHILMEAHTEEKALEQMESQHGDNYHLQAKGCLGEFSSELVEKYLHQRNFITTTREAQDGNRQKDDNRGPGSDTSKK